MQWHLTRGQEIVFAIDGLNRLITICLTQYMDNFFASIERLFREYFSWKRVRNTIENWVFVLDIYFRLHCYTQVTASRSKTATAIALPKTQFSSHRYFFFLHEKFFRDYSTRIRANWAFGQYHGDSRSIRRSSFKCPHWVGTIHFNQVIILDWKRF